MYNLAFNADTHLLIRQAMEAAQAAQEKLVRQRFFELEVILFRNQPPGADDDHIYQEQLDVTEEDFRDNPDDPTERGMQHVIGTFKRVFRIRAVMTHGVLHIPDAEDSWVMVTSFDSPETRFTLSRMFTANPAGTIIWQGPTSNSYDSKQLYDCVGVHIFDEYRDVRSTLSRNTLSMSAVGVGAD